jgi:hypothetical protein
LQQTPPGLSHLSAMVCVGRKIELKSILSLFWACVEPYLAPDERTREEVSSTVTGVSIPHTEFLAVVEDLGSLTVDDDEEAALQAQDEEPQPG